MTAEAAKEVSNGKLFTSAFYGYIINSAVNIQFAGHAALKFLLQHDAIDAIDSPILYSAAGRSPTVSARAILTTACFPAMFSAERLLVISGCSLDTRPVEHAGDAGQDVDRGSRPADGAHQWRRRAAVSLRHGHNQHDL